MTSGRARALAAACCLAIAAIASAQQEPDGIDVRVVAEPSSTRVYVGERVTLTYSLVRGRVASPAAAAPESGDGAATPGPLEAAPPAPLLTPVREVRLVEAPRFPGFWVNEVELEGRDEPDLDRDGMLVTPLRRFHLYPVTAGRFVVESPAYTMLAYPTTFGTVDAMPARITRRASPVAVEVAPLPEPGKPATFGGAVGRFAVTASAGGEGVAVGDAVRLVVEIRGDGNLEATGSPRVARADGLRFATPRRVLVDLGLGESRGTARAVWHLDAIAERPGRFEIGPVELDYFDPASRRYETARSAELAVTVLARASAPSVPGGAPARSIAWGVWGWLAAGALGLVAAVATAVLVLGRRRSPAPRSNPRNANVAPEGPPEAADRVTTRPVLDAGETARLRARLKRRVALAEAARGEGDARAAYAQLHAGLDEVARERFRASPDALPADRYPEAAALYARCREAAFAPVPAQIDRETIEAAGRLLGRLATE